MTQRAPHPDWFAQVNAHGVRAVAAAFGLAVDLAPRGVGMQCPACGKVQRGSQDKRGCAEVNSRGDGAGRGWECRRGDCGESGDAITLAAFVVGGKREPTDWSDLWRQCAAVGLCDPDPRNTAPLVRRPRIEPKPLPPPEPPRRADGSELDRVWRACVAVTADDDVSAWLRSRGLSPETIASRGVAGALPAGTPLPIWATGRKDDGGRPWSESGHRCLLPLYDHEGRLASIRARAVIAGAPGPKALPPKGFAVAGLVMADARGHAVLAGRTERAAHIIVAEGEPAFLSASTAYPEAPDTPAVLGIVAGSWTPEIAARIPTGAVVTIDTDHDPAGDKYAETIRTSLAGRCQVRRTRAPRTS